jgi:hypothetical protein
VVVADAVQPFGQEGGGQLDLLVVEGVAGAVEDGEGARG